MLRLLIMLPSSAVSDLIRLAKPSAELPTTLPTLLKQFLPHLWGAGNVAQ